MYFLSLKCFLLIVVTEYEQLRERKKKKKMKVGNEYVFCDDDEKNKK